MKLVVGWIRFKPGTRDGFMPLASDFAKATRQEPGCIFCEMTAKFDDPDVVLLVEAFADEGAHAAHVRSEHEARTVARLDELGAEGQFENIVAASSERETHSFGRS